MEVPIALLLEVSFVGTFSQIEAKDAIAVRIGKDAGDRFTKVDMSGTMLLS